MRSFRVLNRSCNIILVALVALVAAPAFAATSSSMKQAEARIGGVNKTIWLIHPTALNWEYANDENCGAGHKTVKGNRFYSHKHVAAYAFPCDAIDAAMNPIAGVTTAMIRDYWEWNNGGTYYSYVHSGAEDVTYNCYGYAMGPAVWIQDPAYIYADDYQATAANKAGTIWPLPGHVKKVISICDNGEVQWNFVCQTSEKNRCSRIQDYSAYCPAGQGGVGTLLERKP